MTKQLKKCLANLREPMKQHKQLYYSNIAPSAHNISMTLMHKYGPQIEGYHNRSALARFLRPLALWDKLGKLLRLQIPENTKDLSKIVIKSIDIDKL